MFKQFVNGLLQLMGLRLISLKYRLSAFEKANGVLNLNFDHVLSHYILNRLNGADINFIQIGAYDGMMHDPLRKYLEKYQWKGIMVEPQPKPFSKLQKLYSDTKDITLLNCIISDSPGQNQMYVVDDTAPLPEWMKGSASFYKQHLLKYKEQFPGVDEYIRTINVNSITVDQLLQINQNKFIDLLQIDTEGYDAAILRSFPFSATKPGIIRFESKNLSKKDLNDVLVMLVDTGYRVAYDGGQNNAEDIIAVLNNHNLDVKS